MRVFDLHCDTLSACMEQGQSLLRNHLQLDLQRGRNFEKWIQTFAFFIPDDYRKEAAWQYFQKLYRFWEQEKKLAGNRIRMVTEESLPETECLAMLAIEGGGVLGGDLKKAAMLKDMGISILTLCWNGANEIAGGAHSNERLTPFGKELIAELERLDVIVDVSHLNEVSFYDVAAQAKRPFVATHSNAFIVCPHPRNLKDDQIRRIIETSGLIGLNFYTAFITADKMPDFDDFSRHIDHFLHLGGEDVLALGSDYDGADMPDFLNSAEKVEILYSSVVKCYGKKIADKIFYENAAGFMKKYREGK